MTRILTLLTTAAVLAAPGLAHAGWSRAYAVDAYEPAMYFGGKGGETEPGTDCPTGANPEPNWIAELVKSGYTPEEAAWLRAPENPTHNPIHGQNQMAFRGKGRDNVYIHPTSTADGHLVEMGGAIAEGFDLDANPKTGFVSPAGAKGVDNNFYKAMGCWKTYRGHPRQSSSAELFNDAMRDGSWTVIMVVSGEGGDPRNDESATVGFYVSSDKLVKDGNGAVARDYTYRILPDSKLEARFDARVKDGVITSRAPMDEVWLRDTGYLKELQLLKARLELQMKPDGSLEGFVGGYRPWQPVYESWVAARGPVIEALTWVRLPDVFYALRRNADYRPPGAKSKTHISFAMRYSAVPAYVVMPDASVEVAQAASFKAQATSTSAGITKLPFDIIDGIVVPQGERAVSQTAEQLRPPAKTAAVASGAARHGSR